MEVRNHNFFLNYAKQWHMQHAKQSTGLHISSYIWIMWCQNEQYNPSMNIELKRHKPDQIDARDFLKVKLKQISKINKISVI